MKPLRIGIVGGSLAGLFAGILLERDGHQVCIYERSAHGLGGRGAGLVPQQEVFQVLDLIGAGDLAHVGVVARERIYLDAAGQVVQRMRTPQMQVSWDVLYQGVAARLAAGGYALGRQVERVVDGEQGATLHFADGQQVQVDLAIGADGIGSVVRAAVNPHDHANRYAGYVAWRGLVPETELPPAAHLLLDRFAFYVAPGVHVLGYLVPGPEGQTTSGQRRYNWVWFRKVQQDLLAAELTDRHGHASAFSLARGGLDEERLTALRHDARLALPPPFALALEAEPTPSIQAIFDYEAPRMIGRSAALIGDAAFVVRPHTAMGVAKAAGDAMALQRHLAQSDGLQQALAGFQRERIGVGRQIAAYGQRLGATAL